MNTMSKTSFSPWLIFAMVLFFAAGSFLSAEPIPIPYTENFDDVETMSLPDNWLRYVNGGQANLYAGVANSASYSPTKSLFMASSPNLTFVMISMPEIDPQVDLQDITLSFWTKRNPTFAQYRIGVLEVSGDPSSFVEVLPYFDPGTEWNRVWLNFAQYTGTGRSIAFQLALNGNGPRVNLDDISLYYSPLHDLAGISISGYQHPSAGISNPYLFTITNRGASGEGLYHVQLVDEAGFVHHHQTGLPLEAGQTITLEMDWTAPHEGLFNISGKVILDGDLDPDNDSSSPLAIDAYPEGLQEVMIGQGALHHKYPIDLYWKTSLYETIYQADELNMEEKDIVGLVLFSSIYSTGIVDKHNKVWLANTSRTDLVDSWIPSNEMQLVFDGLLDFPGGENRVRIDFDDYFRYSSGSNLAMMVLRAMDFRYYSSMDDFYHDNTTLMRSRYCYSDNQFYDPENPPQSGYNPNSSRPRICLLVREPQTGNQDQVQMPAHPTIQAFPNPFKDKLGIKIQSPQDASADITIYNLKGQKVSTIFSGSQAKGSHELSWNAMDASGKPLANGIYLLRYQSGEKQITKKLIHIGN